MIRPLFRTQSTHRIETSRAEVRDVAGSKRDGALQAGSKAKPRRVCRRDAEQERIQQPECKQDGCSTANRQADGQQEEHFTEKEPVNLGGPRGECEAGAGLNYRIEGAGLGYAEGRRDLADCLADCAGEARAIPYVFGLAVSP